MHSELPPGNRSSFYVHSRPIMSTIQLANKHSHEGFISCLQNPMQMLSRTLYIHVMRSQQQRRRVYACAWCIIVVQKFNPSMLAKKSTLGVFVSLLPAFIHHSSTNSSSSLILNIITNSPIVTTINMANENHPSTMAVVPTPLWTLPFPRSWAIVLAATDAVCCHNTLTRTNTEAMKMRASAD